MILSISVSLLVASAAIMVYDSMTYIELKKTDLKAQAEIIGSISTAALTFNDRKAAAEYLFALRAKPSITEARIYETNGKIFAQYGINDEDNVPPSLVENIQIVDDSISLVHVIKEDGKQIGTVYLRSNLQLTVRFLSYGVIILMVVVGSLIIGVLVASRLQTFISTPLLEIARVAEGMIHHGDHATQPYKLRAKKYGHDEIGFLTDAFNQMLNHIESRDASLIKANNNFRRIIEASPYGKVMVNTEGKIVLANAQLNRLFGYEPDELLGQPIEILLPERYREGHPKFREGYHAKPELRTMGAGRDLTALHKDGREFPVEIGLNPLETEQGMMIIAAVTDITVRKKLELELKQANTNLEEFTAVASHDLKSPLRGIADLVLFITEDLGDNIHPDIQHNLDRIGVRIRRMERLITDLLSYSRAGRAATELTLIHPKELIDALVEMQAPPSGFEIVITNSSAPFRAVQTPLETVLRNLISNAIKHHDRSEGRIEIKVEEAGSYCIFTVTDDGPGIPQVAHERVFKLFQTLATKKDDSSGIGLAVTKRMVECHGGRIILESTDGVRGSTFKFWWPRFARRDLDG